MPRYFDDTSFQALKNSRATQETIISRILQDHGITQDQLPPVTRSAFNHEAIEVRNAARLAFACGCLITELADTDTGYQLQLRGENPARELWIRARKGACEAETRYKLRQSGFRPPSRHWTDALFSKIEL